MRSIAIKTAAAGMLSALMCVSEAGVATASPSTADFMNAATVCGVGGTIQVDANLVGSVKSLYDGAKTNGKGFVSVKPEIKELIKAQDTTVNEEILDKYLDCVQKLLSLP